MLAGLYRGNIEGWRCSGMCGWDPAAIRAATAVFPVCTKCRVTVSMSDDISVPYKTIVSNLVHCTLAGNVLCIRDCNANRPKEGQSTARRHLPRPI